MASVQAIVQDGWREVLARVYARDVADVQSEIALFKIGEGGFIDVPPKTPIAPDPGFLDLQSEGTPLPSGGIVEFTNGSAVVTGVGTSFLADVAAGDWIKPGPTPSLAVNSAGTPGSEEDGWGQVLVVVDNTTITLNAPYVGATHLLAENRQCHSAAEPLFTFRKALAPSDVLFASGFPAITEVTAIVLAAEANADQLANSPEFFELGLYDANNVLLVYMTFPVEIKTLAVQLNHILELIW